MLPLHIWQQFSRSCRSNIEPIKQEDLSEFEDLLNKIRSVGWNAKAHYEIISDFLKSYPDHEHEMMIKYLYNNTVDMGIVHAAFESYLLRM